MKTIKISLVGVVALILFTLDTASGIDLLDAIVAYIQANT